MEKVGGRIGQLLKLPGEVIASTFQAVATSGPEIVMAILAATSFITMQGWEMLELGEKASSGTLNMAFSAMHNLVGIGAFTIFVMIRLGKVDPHDRIPPKPSTIIGLFFYILSSACLSVFITDGVLSEWESWSLLIIGALFVVAQVVIPVQLEEAIAETVDIPEEILEGGDEEVCRQVPEKPVPKLTREPVSWIKESLSAGFVYAFLVYALVIFVREAMATTFDMAGIGFVSLGGILILFTSYVSSFPEFMMAFRYAVADKKNELLGMLFGSNVIDLAFAGFRSIWLQEPMPVYTTGRFPELLPVYIWTLPVMAAVLLAGLMTKRLLWKSAYPMLVIYVVYIFSGFVLL